MTQIVPDGEAIRIKMSEALAEIEAHVYTLESTLKTSIKANGRFVAEIITLKAERDAALARVSDLEAAVHMSRTRLEHYADLCHHNQADTGGREWKRRILGAFREFDALTKDKAITAWHQRKETQE